MECALVARMKPNEIMSLPLSDPRRFIYELDRLLYMIDEFGNCHNFLGPLWYDVWRPREKGLLDLASQVAGEAQGVLRRLLEVACEEAPEAARDVYGEDRTQGQAEAPQA